MTLNPAASSASPVQLSLRDRHVILEKDVYKRQVHQRIKGQKPFDFVLVDEGQDLDGDAFALLNDLAPHVTVAMDHKQQIYDEGCGETEIIRALGLRRSNLTLLDAFRCCP